MTIIARVFYTLFSFDESEANNPNVDGRDQPRAVLRELTEPGAPLAQCVKRLPDVLAGPALIALPEQLG